MSFYSPMSYLTGQQIRQMKDDELVLVNRIAINSQLTELSIQADSVRNKEPLNILLKASREMREKERKARKIFWGTTMTVKDIKIAFGNNLDKMLRTYFRKLSD